MAITQARKRQKPWVITHDERTLRVAVANVVLQTFARGTTIRYRDARVWVSWRCDYLNEQTTRQWMTRGQDFYPVWHHKWSHGGTASTALSQLVRWVRGLPILGIKTWEYWGSDKIDLLRGKGGSLVIPLLKVAGYPEHHTCVLCGDDIGGGVDWWNLNGVSGPCCGSSSGCRQKAKE